MHRLCRSEDRYHTAILICLTLAAGALFKLSAFAREAFIAAKFGLSATTDAYFGLQQLPLTASTFMFGSFTLAFAPAYAESRRCGEVAWLSGLTVFAVLIGSVLTVCMLIAAPLLLELFVPSSGKNAFATLAILSLCFMPIALIGIWTGVCTARGQNLWAMSMTGLPYLIMTLALFALYGTKLCNELSLPISMIAGFAVIATYCLFQIWKMRETVSPGGRSRILGAWRAKPFQRFLRQLAACSTENAGFAANQLLMIYFLARVGTGTVSANNCAMRIGMLGYGLLAQPLAQLVQARLCKAEQVLRSAIFRRWLLLVAVSVLTLGFALYSSNGAIIRIVYLRGKFRSTDLVLVANILPAWIAYFVVMSLNALVARYLFTGLKGQTYVRHMLCAYAAANLLRFFVAGRMSAPWIIWYSVVAEACAFLANLRSAFAEKRAAVVVPAFAATT